MKRLKNPAALAVFAALILAGAPFAGMESIPFSTVFHLSSGDVEARILHDMRIPRVLSAFLAGSGLAAGGMAFQAMFRNPLATPFTLGVSSGAAFGATLAVILGASSGPFGTAAQSAGSMIGALLSIALVYGLSRLKREFSSPAMLLAGVALSFLFSSLILFIQYISDFAETFRIVRWLMGGIEVVGYGPVTVLAVCVGCGIAVVMFRAEELNLLSAGEDIAATRGVALGRIRAELFFAVSLAVGGVVSVCGPIGFVGMMSPHIMRILLGSNHRTLAPATILFGGSFLVLCDTVARTAIAPAEIPVGVITALLGGPFFLWLLFGKRSL